LTFTPEERRIAIAALKPDVVRSVPIYIRLWWTLKSQKIEGLPWQDYLAENTFARLASERNRKLKAEWLAARGEIDRDLVKKAYKHATRIDYPRPFWWQRY